MPQKRKEDLAQAVFEKRNCGMSFTAIGAEFGITKQRAQQIYNSQAKHIALSKSPFYSLTDYTRRQILHQLKQNMEPSDVTPQIIADTLCEGDLRGLGNHVHDETIAWLHENGYIVKHGFAEFEKFTGTWKAITTHLPNGRRAPWVINRIYEVVAINRSLARAYYRNEWFEIRLDYLKLGFERII